MSNICDRLKEARIQSGISQLQAAQAAGVGRTAICNYEAGIREPSLSVLKKLCDLYDVSADFILCRQDNY